MDSLNPTRGRFLQVLLWSALILIPAGLLVRPEALWVRHYHGIPPWATMTLFAAALLVVGLPLRPLARRIAATLLVLAAALATTPQPLGDRPAWKVLAATPELGASEILANLTYHLAFRLGGDPATTFVAPVFGALFTFLFLHHAERLLPEISPSWLRRLLIGLGVLGAGYQLCFLRDYVENSQLSMPFLLLFLAALERFGAGSRERADRLSLERAAGFLALAILFHGQNAFLLPALPLVARLRNRTSLRRLLRPFLVLSGLLTAVPLLLLVAGFGIHWGNIHLGREVSLLLPLRPEAGGPPGLFSEANLTQMADILLLASPLLPLVPPVLLLLPAARRAAARHIQASPAFLVCALGYLGFLFLMNFSLGFHSDYDLMLTLSTPLTLLLLQGLLAGMGSDGILRRLALPLVLLGTFHAWAVMGSLIPPAFDPGRHPLGEAGVGATPEEGPLLLVNGSGMDITLRPGERLYLEVRSERADSPQPFVLLLCSPPPSPEMAAPLPGKAGIMAFPPDPAAAAPHRILVLANSLDPQAHPPLLPSTPAPWLRIWPAVPERLPAFALQALMADSSGALRPTNAVLVTRVAPDQASSSR